jgi:hypothetical protein
MTSKKKLKREIKKLKREKKHWKKCCRNWIAEYEKQFDYTISAEDKLNGIVHMLMSHDPYNEEFGGWLKEEINKIEEQEKEKEPKHLQCFTRKPFFEFLKPLNVNDFKDDD